MTSWPIALLTGGTGFIGRYVLSELSARGYNVWSLGRKRPASVPPDQHLTLLNPCDGRAIRDSMEHIQPDVVVHLAAATTGTPKEMYAVNTVFAHNLLEAAAAACRAPRVFLAGSAAECGPVSEDDLPVTEDCRPAPEDTYGISKLAQTFYGLARVKSGQSVVVGRFFNVIGAGMPEHLALGAFLAQIARMGREGGNLITGDLDVERDFVEAADVAQLVVALVGRTDVTGVVNICTGQPTSLRLLVDELVRHCPVAIKLQRSSNVRGVTSIRRHFGAPLRLRALKLPVPVLEPARAIEAMLRHQTRVDS